MCHIILLGMNHKTAPVAIREQLVAACKQELEPLRMLPHLEYVDELLFLSTCNRVEFLFTCTQVEEAIQQVTALLKAHLGSPVTSHVESYFYVYQNLEAVTHLFRVAASLDSMVVGEPQILGQLKIAYREATE